MAHGLDKHRSRRNRMLVRELFMREWDPIGVKDVPEAADEYDDYVAKAYVMLTDEGGSAEDIAHYLVHIETDWIGMDQADTLARCGRVADLLVAMKPDLERET